MSLLALLLIAVALGTDAFALAVCIGVMGIGKKKIILVSLVICLFHIVMPLIGLGLGVALGHLIGDLATLIGAVVLILIGLNLLWQALKERIQQKPDPECSGKWDLSSFGGLMFLAFSVSIDALSVGFGLGALKAKIWLTVLVLGVVAGLMTASGFYLGRLMGDWLGEKAEFLGGLILVAVGIKLLI